MRLYYDFHIHSVLSPCGEDEMTPNNIINMALLNKLDVIAVTDHNSALNTPAIEQCSWGKPVIFIPGIEVESCEEVHISCLFPNTELALSMGDTVRVHLAGPDNNEVMFGQQLIMDKNDSVVGKEEKMLLFPTNLSIEEIFDMVWKMGGVGYFSHVDRSSYGVLSVLGVFPDNISSGIAEISDNTIGRDFANKRSELSGKTILYCSDAHRLSDISKHVNFIDIPVHEGDICAADIISWLRECSQEVK